MGLLVVGGVCLVLDMVFGGVGGTRCEARVVSG